MQKKKKAKGGNPTAIADPLKDLEAAFATKREFLDMLEEFPLEPVAWAPPGSVDEYVTKVIQVQEKEKEPESLTNMFKAFGSER